MIGEPVEFLRIPNKQWRSEVIAKHVRKNLGSDKVIIFSCGNAARALEDQGLDVLSGGPQNCSFVPEKWYTPEEVRENWPDRFDATSGHLSKGMMKQIARKFRQEIRHLEADHVIVPSGSGETIYCLNLAFPDKNFIALYDEDDPATLYDEQNPFNRRVQRVALTLMRSGSNINVREWVSHGYRAQSFGP
jgi:hypothetical protein